MARVSKKQSPIEVRIKWRHRNGKWRTDWVRSAPILCREFRWDRPAIETHQSEIYRTFAPGNTISITLIGVEPEQSDKESH